jgi:hypothetical protein
MEEGLATSSKNIWAINLCGSLNGQWNCSIQSWRASELPIARRRSSKEWRATWSGQIDRAAGRYGRWSGPQITKRDAWWIARYYILVWFSYAACRSSNKMVLARSYTLYAWRIIICATYVYARSRFAGVFMHVTISSLVKLLERT